MRFVRYNGDRLGVLSADQQGIVDLTDRLGLESRDPLRELITSGGEPERYAGEPQDVGLENVRLDSPIKRPGKVVAAPLNYEKHIDEALADSDLDLDDRFSIEDFGYFLKAPSSVIGPSESVVVPFSDRRVDHEIELGFVIGEDTKDADETLAWENIFGYTILLDITVRGEQDRSGRKSYDTFTVIGPWIVTADEIDDPQTLDLELQVNGETRQRANTAEMVYTCGDFVRYASIGTTLEAGDVLTTGTPEGVGPITGGDTIHARIESIGEMTVDVEARDVAFADVHVRGGN